MKDDKETNDNFGHVENAGMNQRDLKRGYYDGMAKETDRGAGIEYGGFLGGFGFSEEAAPMEGFCGRAKGWQR